MKTPYLRLSALLLCWPLLAQAQDCSVDITPITPTSRFTDHGNGTVTDTRTGLTWKRCPEGYDFSDSGTPVDPSDDSCSVLGTASFTWQAALQQAATVNAGGGYVGQSDWRLPNIKELTSIVEWACSQPPINETLFPDTPIGFFWSSSTRVSSPTLAMGFYFTNGQGSFSLKSNGQYVRLVRGGS